VRTLLLAVLLSQAPFAGGQMPDPKQMSGMPLPVPDVTVGTVTVRVIRGSLANPLKGQTVELSGASKTATTDEAGRATFTGLTPGTRVKASVVVDGERVESQDFDVPNAGGIRLMLVATDAALEQKAAEDRKLAAAPPVDGVVVIGGESRFVVEVADDSLNVFNLLQIVNSAKRPVQIGGPLVFQLPEGAVGAGMMEAWAYAKIMGPYWERSYPIRPWQRSGNFRPTPAPRSAIAMASPSIAKAISGSPFPFRTGWSR